MRGKFLKSFKVCLALPEKWFCIYRPNFPFSSHAPLIVGSENSI